jgi:hypothetical protein
VSGDAQAPVTQLDAPGLVAALRTAGGPAVELVEPLEGGAVGAWVVRWPDGHEGVLTWFGDGLLEERPEALGEIAALMDLARGADVPVARYEAVVPMDGRGAAILQERMRGQPPEHVTPGLVDRLLELADRRRGLAAGSPFGARPMDLYLTSSGPGYCVHETLRDFGPETAALLERVEEVGAAGRVVAGDDVVHFDYHCGNVLVDPGRSEAVTAILDWDGARVGTIACDLAVLAFDLSWRSPGRLQERVEARLVGIADHDLPDVWAHVGLRLVDWAIRHHPNDVAHWVSVAGRFLPA